MAQQSQTRRALDKLGQTPLGPAFDGFSVYVVGGAVRDALRSEEPTDIDLLAVPRREAEIADPVKTLSEREGMTRVEPESAAPMFLDSENREVTLPRKSRDTDAEEESFEDLVVDPTRDVARALREDLDNRGLTINALAFDVRAAMLLDPVGGAEDVRWGLLRPVSESFGDDPLRVLRVARFAATLGFDVTEDEDDRGLITNAVAGIMSLPGERLALELRKTFARADNAGVFFETLDELGAATVAFPELQYTDMRGLTIRLNSMVNEAARWVCLGEELGESEAEGFADRLALTTAERKMLMLGARHLSTAIRAASANDPETGAKAAMDLVDRLESPGVDATVDDMLAVASFTARNARAFKTERARTRVEGVRQARQLIDAEEAFDRLGITPADLDDPETDVDGEWFGEQLRAQRCALVASSESMGKAL